MTMHAQTQKQNYANAMVELWRNWRAPQVGGGMVGGSRTLTRQRIMENAIRAATNTFMLTPNIVFANLEPGLCGSFSWPTWRLSLNKAYTVPGSLKYEAFLEFCVTGYHETRHCEQFYRVAQGLAGGQLQMPDTSSAKTIDSIVKHGGMGSVQDRIKRFESASTGKQIIPTATVLHKWLEIPIAAATHAANTAKPRFDAFLGTQKPNWFRRSTIKEEVEEWMRECYKATLSGVGHFAQSDKASYEFYKDQPTETDAHGIEDNVKELIEAGVGVTEAAGGNLARDHAVFNHL